MKKIFILSFCLLILIFVSFTRYEMSSKDDANTLRIIISQEPSTLHINNSPGYQISQIAFLNIYEPLIKSNFEGHLEPYLLKNWTYSEDEMAYFFELKEALYFHNGQKLDAAQLKTCLERLIANPKHPHPEYYQSIDQIIIIDDLNLKVQLTEQDRNLSYNLSRPTSAIVYPGEIFVGTGPYQFKFWKHHHHIILEKNKNYRALHSDDIDKVIYSFVSEPFTQYYMLENKQTDIILNFRQFAVTEKLKNQDVILYQQTKTNGKVIMAFNHHHPYFKYKKNREAFASLIKKEQFIQANFFENSLALSSHFSPFHKDAIEEKQGFMANDLELFNGIEPLNIVIPPFEYADYSAELLAYIFHKNNIPFKFHPVEWGEWLQTVYVDKAYDITIVAHIEPMDFYIYGKENYYFNYDKPAFRKQLSHLKKANSTEVYSGVLKELQKSLQDDVANVFLMTMPSLILFHKDIVSIPQNDSNYIFPIQQIRRKEHDIQ